jgi:cell division GTPase FtsZ
MKLAVVGVGNAGSRIVNQILDRETTTGRNLSDGNALLVNSTEPTFDTTERVPEDRRLTIGDVHWEIDSADIDGDPDLAAEVAREERNEINRTFDLLDFHTVDGVLVVAGLAGGTGGGAGAVVIDQLTDICDDPVYAVGVLPEGSEGSGPALTAARALQSFVEKADNVIAFDNDAWRGDTLLEEVDTDEPGRHDDPADAAESHGPADAEESGGDSADAEESGGDSADAEESERRDPSVETDTESEAPPAGAGASGYARLNVALAKRLVPLFAAGEFGGGSSPEHRIDPSDIMRTLDTGGVSSIGHASTEVDQPGGIFPWLRTLRERIPLLPDGESDEDPLTDAATINSLVRRAARSKLTLPCEISSADRALVMLSGPSRTLSRKGFESGRYWLENEADIVDVMAGDEPHDGSTTLDVVVLFSNVTDVPRIEAMQEMAVDHQQTQRAEETPRGTANPQ